MHVHAHKYNTRLQAKLRDKLYDLVDKLDEMSDYDAEEPDPVELMNLQIEYYTLLQFFQCWRTDENLKNGLRNEISRYKNWYRFENGVPIHQYWSYHDTKEAVQLWYIIDTLERMLN